MRTVIILIYFALFPMDFDFSFANLTFARVAAIYGCGSTIGKGSYSRNGDPRYRMAYRMRDVKCYSRIHSGAVFWKCVIILACDNIILSFSKNLS